ncbi:MAG: AAA family ATPase [Phycisphaerae bacterium]|nr:AAA family ATPase [Phycisphaerae bacterium]
MYFEYFGLTTSPFNNTPDPRFFYNTPDHEEALASLLYAVEERKGFVLVSGEVGAGKTLLSRMVLNRVDANVKTALITHTRLNGPELLDAICREFEIDVQHSATSAQYMRALEDFLLEQYARNRLAVVIIDEAQNLPIEALEELRMLGNLEADDAKLLQVLLLGQPELQETFRRPELRQTYQRIFRTFHLRALNRDQTRQYVEHRLRVAGLNEKQTIFEPAAYEAIYLHSDGVPRLINQLCDNALLAAYSESAKVVTSKLVQDVIDQMMSLTTSRSSAAGLQHTEHAASAAMKTVIPGIGQSGMKEQLIRQAEHVRSLDEKLAAIEGKIRASSRRGGSGIESSEGAANSPERMEATRIRNEAVELLKNVTRSIREADDRMRQALTRAESAAESADGHVKSIRTSEETAAHDHKSAIARFQSEIQTAMETAQGLRAEADAIPRRIAQSQAAFEQQLQETLDKAAGTTAQFVEEARSLVATTRDETADMQNRLAALIRNFENKITAADERAVEMEQRHQSEISTLRSAFEEAIAAARERNSKLDAEQEEIRTLLKKQAWEVVEQIQAARDRTTARAESAAAEAEQFSNELRTRVDTVQNRIADLSIAAEERIKSAATGLTVVRDQLVAEAEGNRVRATQLLKQADELLTSTRQQCISLLGEMRARADAQTKKAEEILQSRVADGIATLGEITTKLADARQAADQSREQLQSILQHATGELASVQESLDSTLVRNRSEIARLSSDAAAIKVDFQTRFEDARAALDSAIAEHRKTAVQRADELVNAIDLRIDNAHTDAEARVRALQAELNIASQSAARISSELENAVTLADARVRECQARFAQEVGAAQKEVASLVERNRAAVEGTRAQVASLSRQADETTSTMRNEIGLLKEAARSRLDTAARDFETLLADSSQKLLDIHQQADSAAVEIAERLLVSRDEAERSVTDSERATSALRQQTRDGLAEVRECLLQMTERADRLRREMLVVSDDIAASAKSQAELIQRTGEHVTGQISGLREQVQHDADANFKRLALIRQQVEESGERMRHNAAKLLDQVQCGAAALRGHADELLARAHSGAETLNESASRLLLQAQTAAEGFRTQAESLLHKAESTTAAVRDEVQSLRTRITSETDQMRQQLAAARIDLAEARESVEQLSSKSVASHQNAQTQAEELIRQAQAAQARSETLLSMPRELVDEARRQAEALTSMSRKISTIVKQLATTEARAEQNKSALDEAASRADDKVDLLKRHTERLGQLVGIIRQLYGTMDARIERLRGRLGQVDDIVRTVPHEIESLRAALDASDGTFDRETPGARMRQAPAANVNSPRNRPPRPNSRSESGAATSAVVDRGTRTQADRISVRAADKVGSRSIGNRNSSILDVVDEPADELRTEPAADHAGQPGAAPSASMHSKLTATAGSLGQLVQNSQKINNWLKEMIGEEALIKHIPKAGS